MGVSEVGPQAGDQESLARQADAATALRSMYRGIWANTLQNDQHLPVGGSFFGNALTTKLELDLSTFDDQLGNFTEENLKKIYEQNKEQVIAWLKEVGSDMDPYTYFLCYQVQQKIHALLQVEPQANTSAGRGELYRNAALPKLSEMKGKTECGERAALGQYILQKAGAESAYVSGVTMLDIGDENEYPEDHSFIVLKHPTTPDATLIFDIARPHKQNIPRLLETDVPFTYELLKGKEELLVGATEVLQGGRLWFGVGEPVAGYHRTIEKPAK